MKGEQKNHPHKTDVDVKKHELIFDQFKYELKVVLKAWFTQKNTFSQPFFLLTVKVNGNQNYLVSNIHQKDKNNMGASE